MATTKMPNDLREERLVKSINALLEKPTNESYGHAIAMWLKLIETPDFRLKPDHFHFIFSHLLPSALNNEVRKDALKALSQTVPLLQVMDYRGHPQYKEFLEKSISTYMPKVKEDIDQMPEWAQIWCLFLTVVRNDMARSIQINAFLSVAESGFRSSNIEMRTKSFLCWRKLIEIYASEGQLQHKKRVRLIAVPLQTTASKNLDLATAKFGCWWYLINNISPDASEDHTKCFVHFLNFCFGPLNELPLEGYIKNFTAVSPGKLYNELKLTVIVALIRILGPSTQVVATLKLDRPMDEIKRQFSPEKIFPTCRREIIYCCAEATVLLYSLRKLDIVVQLQITRNIWDNLFALIKSDDKLTKSMILVIDAITAIVNINRVPVPCIQTIFESIKAAKFNLKGAQLLTEFCISMVSGLNAAAQAVKRSVITSLFGDLILSHFQIIHMLENKTNFVVALTKEAMNYQKKCSFVIWSLIWTKLLSVLEQTHAIQSEFVKFGLENHFNEMIQEKEAWIFNWNIQPKNQYLNRVALLFQTAAKDEAASYNIVEVVACMLNSTSNQFDKNTIPKEVLLMFHNQMERFVSTEFATTFVDALNNFLKDMKPDQCLLIYDELLQSLDVVKKCSKSMYTSESLISLRTIVRAKVKAIESVPGPRALKLTKLLQEWLNQTSTKPAPGSASTKMPQPPVPPKKKDEEEFVPIKRDWSFDPKSLTDHQIERMKERRDDIPALYNDNSQSQDTRSLQPWALKTTPAAESKDPKPEQSIFAAIVGAQAQPNSKPLAEANTNGTLDTSKSKGAAKKPSKIRSELSRLTIDTVEGRSLFEVGDKKTRRSRRGSMEIRTKDGVELRTSPRKANGSGGDRASTPSVEPSKPRRVTIAATERILKNIPEADSTLTKSTTVAADLSKGTLSAALKVSEKTLPSALNKDSSASVAKNGAPVTTPKEVSKTKINPVTVIKQSPATVIKESPASEAEEPSPPSATQITTDTPTISIIPLTNGNSSSMTVIKVAPPATVSAAPPAAVVSVPPREEEQTETIQDINNFLASEDDSEPTPMVVIPMESNPVLPTTNKEAEKEIMTEALADTEALSGALPTTEPVSEPMDVVGSESFVEEMNLAVSANTSVNLQRSIVSSPEDVENLDARESTFLNDTINISPILKVAVTAKESTSAVVLEVPKVAEAKVAEIMTTPKRSNESVLLKENHPTAISTTPHSFSKLTGRGAQMLQQTKLFQESTPKEKPREEPVISKEDTLARMMVKTVPCRSSPSTSILRRKRLEDDMDDSLDSPAAKKKKVSFSDPPVSATKEFIRDSDRQKSSSLARMLMRKSRTDSASELNSLNVNYMGLGSPGSLNGQRGSSDSDEETERKPAMPMDDSKIFEYLQKKYTEADEDEVPPKLPLSQIRTLTDVLIHSITQNAPAKEEFFQKLMLAMPKDALHWSVKENSSYAFLNEVKEQVSSATFINFIINLLKTDNEFQRKMTGELGLRMDAAQTLDFIAAIMPRKPLT